MADITFNRKDVGNFYYITQETEEYGSGPIDTIVHPSLRDRGVCVRESNQGKTSFVRTAAFNTNGYNVPSITVALLDCSQRNGYSESTVIYFAVSDICFNFVPQMVPRDKKGTKILSLFVPRDSRGTKIEQ